MKAVKKDLPRSIQGLDHGRFERRFTVIVNAPGGKRNFNRSFEAVRRGQTATIISYLRGDLKLETGRPSGIAASISWDLRPEDTRRQGVQALWLGLTCV